MAKKRLVPPTDAMFLWGESAETMMHVASLMPFTPPADAGPTYLRDLLAEVRRAPVNAPFNMKLSHPHLLAHPLQSWVEDDKFDIEYHVRRSALASPGDERELGILVSRLHSHQLDFTRPPWEVHIIEGLERGRFAVYTKVHHSLVDGFSAVKLLIRSLSADPDDRTATMFYSLPKGQRPKPARPSLSLKDTLATAALGAAGAVTGAVDGVAGVAKAVLKLELGRSEDPAALIGGREAPHTILNQRTSRTRRFATQVYETERLKVIAKASTGTLNDVVMAICGGALRRYLLELDELPDKPLVAMVPVNIRGEGDQGGGNKVGVMLASMGTDVANPVQRLESVIASTKVAKSQMKGMGQIPALAYSGYLLAPAAFQLLAAMGGVKNPLPTTMNLVLSNVVGPKQTLYMAGSELEAVYPLSIPAHSIALNITLETYADKMCFGFIGDRDALPSLQRLAVYTGEALAELEAALGLPGARLPGTDTSRKRARGASKATREALTKKKPAAG